MRPMQGGCSPDAVAGRGLADGPAHGDAGVAGADLAGELIDGLGQSLPSQRCGVHGSRGGHGYAGTGENALQPDSRVEQKMEEGEHIATVGRDRAFISAFA